MYDRNFEIRVGARKGNEDLIERKIEPVLKKRKFKIQIQIKIQIHIDRTQSNSLNELQTTRNKEMRNATEESTGQMWPKQANKCPSSPIAR